MAKVYFKVRTLKTDSRKDVNILIRFKSGKIDQIVSTGEHVQFGYWDFSKQNFNRKSFKGKSALEGRLSKLKTYILEEASVTNEIGKGWLSNLVDRYRFPDRYAKDPNMLSMLDWIQNWIQHSNNAYRTIRKYHNTLDSLKEFNAGLSWEDIDLKFYDDFISFLKGKNYSKNTIADRIKIVKVFCNVAFERKVHSNTDFRSKGFKKQTEESLNIYLNEEELELIYNADFSKKPYYDRVRDQFLIGCWTGCRFSDLDKVKNENIDGGFLKIEQAKTKRRVIIPLHPVVSSILNKYDGDLPQIISNQKFNEYLKEVAENAGITGKVTKSITKGGVRTTELVDKFKMVTSHTARRSFATNLYKSGFPSISIMAITGHKTEKAFLSYIKVTEEEHAQLLMEHWKKKVDL